ncbi:response regulator [Paenibacillus sp. NPDC058071]|uniref:response regulator n=1 Tax=Paenibacillus sp. NPDC058071 TaxID=3346326 RepID=UPI0036DC4FFC
MIRTILIDDERLALRQLEHMLLEWDGIAVVGAYTNPFAALEEAPALRPDVIFLDINMPEMDGLQAAEKLQDAIPGAQIVFITAYDRYAIDAFELSALDYLLKPINRSRIAKTVERIKNRYSIDRSGREQETSLRTGPAVIHCFDTLRHSIDGGPPSPFRWRTSKALELFAYLLHNRDAFVSKDSIIELLWPGQDAKKSAAQLYTTVYQARQCLKQVGLHSEIRNMSGGEGYMLQLKDASVDADLWEREGVELGELGPDTHELYQHWLDRYEGDYLGQYDFLWAESERQRLRAIWYHQAMKLAEYYADSAMNVPALTVYKRITALLPYYEEAHFGLMIIYDRIGDRRAVLEQYRLLCRLFKEELAIPIPKPIEDWMSDWTDAHPQRL